MLMSHPSRKYLQIRLERIFLKESFLVLFMDQYTMEKRHRNIESYSVLANSVPNFLKIFL